MNGDRPPRQVGRVAGHGRARLDEPEAGRPDPGLGDQPLDVRAERRSSKRPSSRAGRRAASAPSAPRGSARSRPARPRGRERKELGVVRVGVVSVGVARVTVVRVAIGRVGVVAVGIVRGGCDGVVSGGPDLVVTSGVVSRRPLLPPWRRAFGPRRLQRLTAARAGTTWSVIQTTDLSACPWAGRRSPQNVPERRRGRRLPSASEPGRGMVVRQVCVRCEHVGRSWVEPVARRGAAGSRPLSARLPRAHRDLPVAKSIRPKTDGAGPATELERGRRRFVHRDVGRPALPGDVERRRRRRRSRSPKLG